MESNITFEQPLLSNVQHGAAIVQARATEAVSQASVGLKAWTILLSLILGAVVYDQGIFRPLDATQSVLTQIEQPNISCTKDKLLALL